MPAEVYAAVMARDRERCQAPYLGFAPEVRCSQGLHVHHAVLRSQGGKDVLEDLLVLCPRHHVHAHEHARTEAELCGVIRHRAPG